MTIRILKGWLLAAVCGLVASATPAAPGNPVPAGSPLAAQVSYEFAVFYIGKPARPPLQVLKEGLQASRPAPRLIDTLPRRFDEALVLARLDTDAQKDYRPPSLQSLQYFGRGLTREQAVALQTANTAFILRFAHSQQQGMPAYRQSLRLIEQVARETGGLLWDEETREVFSADEWHRRRLDSWQGELPDVSKQTVIHAYQSEGKLVRAITLGMAKFGLPDIVVEDFSWSLNRPMGTLVNLLSQSLAEGMVIGPQGRCDVDMKALRHAGARASQSTDLLQGSTGRAQLKLVEGRRDDGDPDNRLAEIRFDAQAGADVHARQQALISSLYGSQDAISYVKHNQALLAASEAARARLPGLQRSLAQGLAPGEYILVKAPFATPQGGQEWMWVEVTAWKGDVITGMLKNEPFNIPTLHGGQQVRVSQAQVFDYIRRFADGREEGNETGRLIEQQHKGSR